MLPRPASAEPFTSAGWVAVFSVAFRTNFNLSFSDHSLAAGMDDHLSKPLQKDKLESALARRISPAG